MKRKMKKSGLAAALLPALILALSLAAGLCACGEAPVQPDTAPSVTTDETAGGQPSQEELSGGLDVWRAIADLDFPENYFVEYDITRTFEGYASSESLRLIKSDGRWWAAVDREGVTAQVYACDGGREYSVTDSASGVTAWYHSEDGFVPEICLGIPSAGDVAAVLQAFLTDGVAESQNGTVTAVQTGLLSSSSRNVADIVFQYEGEDIRDEYLIDLGSGLIVIAENYRGDELYASLSASHYLDDTTVNIHDIFEMYVAMQ